MQGKDCHHASAALGIRCAMRCRPEATALGLIACVYTAMISGYSVAADLSGMRKWSWHPAGYSPAASCTPKLSPESCTWPCRPERAT